MGFFANVFNGDSHSSRKHRRKGNYRRCRIEEFEQRELLSANPFLPPDVIDFGVAFHDGYCKDYAESPYEHKSQHTTEDTFYVAWNGGADGTKLTELVIDLSNAEAHGGLLFGPNTFRFLDDALIEKHEQNLIRVTLEDTLLRIEFLDAFDGNMFGFCVSVYTPTTTDNIYHIVGGPLFHGATVDATFIAENFHDLTIREGFNEHYSTGNLAFDPEAPTKPWIPEGDTCHPDEPTTWAGATTVDCQHDTPGDPGDPGKPGGPGKPDDPHRQKPLTGSLSGYVYHDRNNDGQRDDLTEEGIPNVRLELWIWNDDSKQYENTGRWTETNDTGFYFFDDVEAFQNYQIREAQPTGWESGKNAIGTMNNMELGWLSDDLSDAISGIWMAPNGIGQDYNFAEYKNGSLSGYVYHDRNNDGHKDELTEEGIAGEQLELWVWNDALKQYEDTGRRAETNADGAYRFDNVEAFRQYKIQQIQPNGWTSGKNTVGNVDGVESGLVSEEDSFDDIWLGSNSDGENYNFAEYKNGSISGYVYYDQNNDGHKDETEDGIAKVKLELWVWNEDTQEYEDTGRRAETDDNGYYRFDDVGAFREYRVQEVQPEGWESGKNSVGMVDGEKGGWLNEYLLDAIDGIWISTESVAENYNFGEYKNGSISGYVYHDQNNDGQKDETEEGIAGAELELWVWNEEQGQYVDTTTRATTNDEGFFIFQNVEAFNRYQVRQVQPDGWEQGKNTVGTMNGEKTDAGWLADGLTDVIEGIWMPTGGTGEYYMFGEHKNGSISGYVYHDLNNDGQRDALIEKGIAGVQLELWVWNKEQGQYVDTTTRATTNDEGFFIFQNVEAFNRYQVRQVQPDGWEQGKNTVGTMNGEKTDAGWLADGLTDVIEGIWMPTGGTGEYYMFGEYKNSSIGGTVVDDEGKPIPNAIIELFDEGGNKIGETKTDDEGNYEFTNVPPGNYWLKQHRPDDYCGGGGSEGTLGGFYDSDENAIFGIEVKSGDEGQNYDFFAFRRGEISGFVFHDANESGEWDEGEGLEGVNLSLWVWDTELNDYRNTLKTALTDADGYYLFTGLCAGKEYQIRAGHPESEECWIIAIGTMDEKQNGEAFSCGETEEDGISKIVMIPGGKGANYNFFTKPIEIPIDPPEPPPVKDVPQNAPPFVKPFGTLPRVLGGGAIPTGGSSAGPAPFASETLRTAFGGGSVAPGTPAPFSWNLSVINAGYPRSNGETDGMTLGEHASRTTMILSDGPSEIGAEGNTSEGARYVSASWTPLPMAQSGWYVRDANGVIRKRFTFGPDGGVPIVGDFSGDGIDRIAVYHEGNWYIDLNGNGHWDEEDLWAEMGGKDDHPVVGDWDGDGKADIGIFGPMKASDPQIMATESGLPSDLNTRQAARPKNMPPNISVNDAVDNVRAMKHSQGGGVRLDVVDHVFQFGNEGDKAFVGDFTGDGIATIGVFRDGKWYIDKTGTGEWKDRIVVANNDNLGLGSEGIPIVGDFNGDGISKIGLYVDGTWYLDTTGDFVYDTQIEFGEPGDHPVVGDFDGSGIAQLAVYRASSSEKTMMTQTPEPAMGVTESMIAQDFGGKPDQTNGNSQPDEDSLKNHSRSIASPHTNAPLTRGQ